MIKELTVLMPTYNCARYIKDSTNCILNQTFTNFELLIVDDGSEDNTEEVISEISDSRIHYIKKTHTGLSSSLNFGLKTASNNWVARMDADDLCHPERFMKQICSTEQPEENYIFFTWTAFFRGKRISFLEKTPKNEILHRKALALHPYISHSSVIYHKNHILDNGGYDEKIKIFEDYELWLRIKDKTTFCAIPEFLNYVRLRKNSLSRMVSRSNNRIIYDFLEKYYIDLNKHFNISDLGEQQKLRGWREYFYGDKDKTRHFWRDSNLLFSDIRVLSAYLISYFPDYLFNTIRDGRFRPKTNYFISRFIKDQSAKKNFKETLQKLLVLDANL